MIAAGYRIEPEPARRFVRFTLHGFWDDATIDRYQADLKAMAGAATKAGIDTRGYRVLIDLRTHDLLSKAHSTRMQAVIDQVASDVRTAIVVAHAGLLKTQVARVGQALRPRFFTSETDAMAWLFQEPDPG